MAVAGNGEGGELREKESEREGKIRMGKCWLVKDTSEYASPFFLFCAWQALLSYCCSCGIRTERYTGQAEAQGRPSFVYLCMEKLICQINRCE